MFTPFDKSNTNNVCIGLTDRINNNFKYLIKMESNQNIKIFENNQFGQIRTAGTSENPLFCLNDIGRILEIKNIRDCKSKLK